MKFRLEFYLLRMLLNSFWKTILLQTIKWQLIACATLNYWALAGHLMQPIKLLFLHHVESKSHCSMPWVGPNVTKWQHKQQWRQCLHWTSISPTIFQLLQSFGPIWESSLQMRMKWSLSLALDMLFDSIVQHVGAYQNKKWNSETSKGGDKGE